MKLKHKKQILKAAREKQQIIHNIYKYIRITADLSIEMLQARREWQDILKVIKENNLQPRLLYPARISFKYEGKIKSFADKQISECQHHQTRSPRECNGNPLQYACL